MVQKWMLDIRPWMVIGHVWSKHEVIVEGQCGSNKHAILRTEMLYLVQFYNWKYIAKYGYDS